MQLILASSSPYRQELLTRLGIPFRSISPDIDETPMPGESPAELALRLAQAKAHAVATRHPNALVIGADQVAAIEGADGSPIGKPGTTEKAHRQLQQLSGRTALFYSALCTSDGHRTVAANIVTRCRFRTLDDTTIKAYLQREPVLDSAGSAKAEGLGIALMESIHSDDPTAIIGLPLIELSRMLRQFGLDPITYPCFS